MGELTIAEVIDGYRYGPLLGTIEDRANGIAQYFTRGKAVVALERVDGTVAHFVQQTMLENPMFRSSGGMGQPYRYETCEFEIDMAPQPAG